MSASTDSYARKRPLPILNRKNYDEWFDLGELHFQSKGLEYVLTTTLEEYALIAQFQDLSTAKDGAGTPSSESSQTSKTRNIEKEKEWKKADAEAKFIIITCVEGFDSESIRKLKTSRDMWAQLRSKYFDKRPSIGSAYLNELVTYKMKDDTTIECAWTELQRLRSKVVMTDPTLKDAFKEEKLFHLLLRSLPLAYDAIRDSMEAFQGTVEDKLRILHDKEDRLKTTEEASALAAAYDRRNQPTTPRRRSLNSSGSSGRGSPSNKRTCHICKGTHFVRNCPYLEKCQKLAYKEAERASSRKLRHKSSKGYLKHDTRTKGRRDKGKKHESYAAEGDTSDSESNTDDESEDKLSDEVAAISKVNLASKVPTSKWIADTGASAHMTDQLQLFRGPLVKIKRRIIKVGGGKLYSDHMGTAVVRIPGGKSLRLRKTLLVPRLGVNLLSGRKMCMSGLKGTWDRKAVYLHDANQQEVLRAKRSGGVYVVDRISTQTNDSAFISQTALTPIPYEAACPAQTEVLEPETMDFESSAPGDPKRISKQEEERYNLWHRRFAHLGPGKLKSLHKVTTLDKAIRIPKKMCPCQVCALTKMRNRTSKKLSPWKEELLELVSIDIAGPFPTSVVGNRYFLEIVDNKCRKIWVIPLKTKDGAIPELCKWKNVVELQTGQKLRAVCSDNAPELKAILDEWCASYGIIPQYTTVYKSNQNGVAERAIQTTEGSMRAMIKEAKLPLEFWDEAAMTDAYLRNRVATGLSNEKPCPEEGYTGEKPSVDHIRVWGTKCYAYVDPKSLPANTRHDKLMDRGRAAVFMGYNEQTTKQYRIYAPDLGYTIRSSVVTFDETVNGGTLDLRIRTPTKDESQPTFMGESQGTPNILPERKPRGRPPKAQAPLAVPEPSALPDPGSVLETSKTFEKSASSTQKEEPQPKRKRGRPRKTGLPEPIPEPPEPVADSESPPDSIDLDTVIPDAEPPSILGKRPRDAEDDDLFESLQRQKIAAFIASMILEKKTFADAENDNGILTAYSAHIEDLLSSQPKPRNQIPIPLTYHQAISDPVYGMKWREAIEREIRELKANGTWKKVDCPNGSNLISTKWVFTIKYTPEGAVDRYKARLVARGFSQVQGIDYNETFAPTVRMDTLRMLMAIVAAKDLECHQVDVNNAFTESGLDEDIFLSPPDGVKMHQGKVLKVLRSLYGLKQAGRNWNQRCEKEMLAIGFVQSQADPCLFVHPVKKLIVLVYVDDMAVAAPTKVAVEWFKQQLSALFKIKDLGEIGKILGVRITRDRVNRTLTMDQAQYMEEVCTRYGVTNSKENPIPIPINGWDSLRPANDEDERTDRREYQQIIGSLLYAMLHTRPDLAIALGKLSQYLSDPAKFHATALKTLLRYVASTLDRCITFGGEKHDLRAYSDADWANDKVDRKSTSGGVCMLNGGPVSWYSRKQKSVATSSTESEYIALASIAKQSQWLAQVLRDMGHADCLGKNPNQVDIRGDNTGSLALVKNPHLHERSKHIDICHHYTRDLAKQGKIRVSYTPTVDMVADGLTKPLPKAGFMKFVSQLGMVNCRPWGTVGASQ
jgi:hypothetical protein